MVESVNPQHLELYSRLSNGSEGRGLPVGLFCLFPHHYVEGRGVLVAKNEASVVVICHCVHVESSLKVNATESCVACKLNTKRRSALIKFR